MRLSVQHLLRFPYLVFNASGPLVPNLEVHQADVMSFSTTRQLQQTSNVNMRLKKSETRVLIFGAI